MNELALAPRNGSTGIQDTCVDDPFASPVLSTTSPTRPMPCAYPPSTQRPPRHVVPSGETENKHYRSPRQPARDDRFKPGSMSSIAGSTVMTPVASTDLEKASLAQEREQERPSRDSKRSKHSRSGREAEKAMSGEPNGSRGSSHRGIATSRTYGEADDEVDEGRCILEEKAVNILLFLSGPCVLLSTLNTLWACIALVITLLSQPIRLCAKRPTFGQQVAGLLGPTLNLQLRSIYTPLPPHADQDSSYHVFTLFAVHILSPLLSFALMFGAWIIAVYWLSSAVVGDPAGQDKRDDGMETVLGLRKWWERWLTRCLKDEE